MRLFFIVRGIVLGMRGMDQKEEGGVCGILCPFILGLIGPIIVRRSTQQDTKQI